MRWGLLALAVFGVAACGGYQTGIKSEPYVDAAGPAAFPVKCQGIDVYASAFNGVRTSDSGWLFPGIPLYVNPVNKPGSTEPPFTVYVSFDAGQDGFVFCPGAARLILDGVSYAPSGFELDKRYAFPRVIARPRDSGCEADTVFPLGPGREGPSFLLSFPVPPPHPDREFALDLSRAISGAGRPDIPIIKFRKTKWSEWYS